MLLACMLAVLLFEVLCFIEFYLSLKFPIWQVLGKGCLEAYQRSWLVTCWVFRVCTSLFVMFESWWLKNPQRKNCIKAHVCLVGWQPCLTCSFSLTMWCCLYVWACSCYPPSSGKVISILQLDTRSCNPTDVNPSSSITWALHLLIVVFVLWKFWLSPLNFPWNLSIITCVFCLYSSLTWRYCFVFA